MERRWQNVCLIPLLTLTFFVLVTVTTYAQITVVNMIPNAQSGETNQDSEPNIAVNTANPLQIAASAFTPDPGGGTNAPIYVSTDGGNTWALNSIVPSQVGSVSGTRDITLRFSGPSSVLYAAILRSPGSLRLNILRTSNFTGATPMTVLVDRNNIDQPYIQAATVMGGSGVSNDRIYVGDNDFAAAAGRTATIDRSLNAATAPPPAGINTFRIETRTTAGQDGPQIRPTIHLNGTVYGAFYRWTNITGTNTNATITADVVVVRDDDWGTGTNPFVDLVDTGDSNAGMRVVTGVTVPWQVPGLSQERIGGSLSIVVDPRDSDTVYIAWANRPAGTTNYTLHVRHSTDGGANWDATDLRTINNAINPALAINSRGRVGFLYQQLTGTGATQRWETHFERTDNNFTAVNNQVLANVPAGTPARVFYPYIGDYVHLMAVGKNFYGVFSANNTPNNANFPNAVTYLRNANFTTNTLLNTNNITPVNVSIDPFFFRAIELVAESDFYVSDWTDSPTSRDTGLEPSTHPVFYTTSDVWNRRSNAPGGFNANNQPQSQDPQMVTAGKNYAFARIRRNASGTAGTVTAHFLVSEFGTGSNYQNAGSTSDPTISFSTTDLEETMTSGYEWGLPVTTSSHTCLAVEISTPSDPIVAPSVLGHAPGWPTTDLMFINDNNKAQRNMGVYHITTAADCQFCFYAIAHNAATFPRDMVIRYATTREAQKKLGKLSVRVIGAETESYQFGNDITLANMAPGENRWIELTFDAPGGSSGELLPVLFDEMVGNTAVNGFTIAAQPSPMSEVVRGNLEFHGEVLTRMAAAFNIKDAEEKGLTALRLSRERMIPDEKYVELVRSHVEPISYYLFKLLTSRKSDDPFDIRKSINLLSKELETEGSYCIASAHSKLLHKLDAFLTMLQKLEGDPADILQNVRWQSRLYSRVPRLKEMRFSKLVLERSQEFVIGYANRKVGNDDYPGLIRDLMDSFRATAEALGSLGLEHDIQEMKLSMDSPTALQKAHRGYLLKLQSLVK